MDVQVERERRVRLRHAAKSRSTQVPPSGQEELLHVDRRGPRGHAGRVAAESRQRRVPGESRCRVGVVS